MYIGQAIKSQLFNHSISHRVPPWTVMMQVVCRGVLLECSLLVIRATV